VRQNGTPGGVFKHPYSSVNCLLPEAASDALRLPFEGKPHVPPDTSLLLEVLVLASEIRMEDLAWNTVILLGFEI
jgi:hypothetical protein